LIEIPDENNNALKSVELVYQLIGKILAIKKPLSINKIPII
jgi:hypothetical protein